MGLHVTQLLLSFLLLGAGLGAWGADIVGGHNALPRDWRWIAAVKIKANGQAFHCGGSRVSQYWVLTAAHCVNGSELSDATVRLGPGDQNDDTLEWLKVTKVVVHPRYRNKPDEPIVFDVALLRLPSNTPLGPLAPLADPGWDPLADRSRCRVAGWGKISSHQSLPHPKILQEVQVPLNACVSVFHHPLPTYVICSSAFPGSPSATCQGDSGGPLTCQRGKVWVQVGLVSFGLTPCEMKNKPTAYMSVSYFRHFIDRYINPFHPSSPRTSRVGLRV